MTACERPCDGSSHPRCRAHNRSGAPCRMTPIRGGRVCRMHGGQAPQVVAVAQRREAASAIERTAGARFVALAEERPELDPGEVLLELVREASLTVAALRAMVAEAGEIEGINHLEELVPTVRVQLLGEWSDRLAHYASLAIKAGIEERRVRLAEADAMRIVDAAVAALDDPEWGLSDDQRSRGLEVVAKHFQALPA